MGTNSQNGMVRLSKPEKAQKTLQTIQEMERAWLVVAVELLFSERRRQSQASHIRGDSLKQYVINQ